MKYYSLHLILKYKKRVLAQVKPLHKAFAPYRRINEGKSVVLLACGSTIKKFVPVKDVIYVGVNGALRFNIPLDYLFLTDLIKNDKTVNDEIDNYSGNDCKKFYAILPQRRLT
ncbi:MAG: hypothetical protein LUH05_08230 [Candidatus Gastranaerophilales bacterium]|nr:hypothetical protein [Candidatus Gastranaerophilales bacterium]